MYHSCLEECPPSVKNNKKMKKNKNFLCMPAYKLKISNFEHLFLFQATQWTISIRNSVKQLIKKNGLNAHKKPTPYNSKCIEQEIADKTFGTLPLLY
jgi:hypothetical protein